jgi:hypothetical protein
MKKLLLMTPILFGCFTLFSATYTTTAVPGTWDLGGAPGASDDIVVSHDWLAYNSGALLNYTGVLTINTGGKFTINGDFTTNGGTVSIASGSNLNVTGNSIVADESAGGAITLNGTWHVAGNMTNNFNTWTGSGNLVIDGSFTNNGDIGITTLPVELVQFEASCGNDGFVELVWVTASEVNSDRFTIMRSNDGINFTEISTLSAKGNSQQFCTYSYVDRDANSEFTYYQLIEFDKDGATQKSPIAFVNAKHKKEYSISSYPNPTSDGVSVQFKSDVEGNYTVNILNQNGQLLYNNIVSPSLGDNRIDLSLVTMLSGIYHIQLIDATGVISNVRVVKN